MFAPLPQFSNRTVHGPEVVLTDGLPQSPRAEAALRRVDAGDIAEHVVHDRFPAFRAEVEDRHAFPREAVDDLPLAMAVGVERVDQERNWWPPTNGIEEATWMSLRIGEDNPVLPSHLAKLLEKVVAFFIARNRSTALHAILR